jgi:hypothetical protein
MWIDLPSHLAASVSSRKESQGRLTSLVVKTKQTGEVLEVKDLSRVPSEKRETITNGTLVEVRVTSLKTVRPEAILLRVLQAPKGDAEETSSRDNG